jgi:glycine cleavage system H lipoate-binding protein
MFGRIVKLSSRKLSYFVSQTDDVYRIMDITRKVMTKESLTKCDMSKSYYGQVGVSLENLDKIGEIVYKDPVVPLHGMVYHGDVYFGLETSKSTTDLITPISGICVGINNEFIDKYSNIDNLKTFDKKIREKYMDSNNLYIMELKISDIKKIIENL